MAKYKKVSILVSLFTFFIFGTAFATYVDFRALSPSHTNNILPSPYVTLIPGGGTITIEAFSLPNFDLKNLWWDNTDGFGISSSAGYEKDEIELMEAMRISFSSPVHVSHFDLTDLFIEGPPQSPYAEIGVWYSPGLGFNLFSQYDPLVSNGEFQLDIGHDIDEIWFSAPAKFIEGQNHEFSIAGVEVTSVPEPSTLILLGCGLIAFAGLGRNRLKRK